MYSLAYFLGLLDTYLAVMKQTAIVFSMKAMGNGNWVSYYAPKQFLNIFKNHHTTLRQS
jgi:hypothetical protein